MGLIVPGRASSLVSDHINRNRLDNRRSNLRVCTRAINALNSDYSEKSKGYGWSNQSKKWKAYASIMGHTKHLGYFDTETEAIAAVRRARQQRLSA